MKFFWGVASGQSGILCTTKTEAVVLYVRIEKAPVESGSTEPAPVRQAVEPGAAFQYTFVLAILGFWDGVSGVRQVIGIHPFPYVP